MEETLIENAYIATMDEDRTAYSEGSTLIEDDVITDVRPPRSPEHNPTARIREASTRHT